MIDLAIIIPTLNEEHFIGYLLDSIIRQNIQPKEIVIVDAYSKDTTLDIAKKYNVNKIIYNKLKTGEAGKSVRDALLSAASLPKDIVESIIKG